MLTSPPSRSALRSYAGQPMFQVLALSVAGLLLLWLAPAAVWGAMPVWLVAVAILYRRARTDDWLVLPAMGLPFVWATGLAQYAMPPIIGVCVLASIWAEPIRGRIHEAWDSLGAEKWFALAAFAAMLPSVFVVSGGGRIYTYVRTVGLIGVSLAGLLVCSSYARRWDGKRIVHALIAFAGVAGLWTLAQLVYKGSILLPLQRTSSLIKVLPGRAGLLAARQVAEAAGIKYESVGANHLVVRPNVFFVHAVTTGAIACLLAPLVWRRIRHRPIWVAVVSTGIAGLVGAALVASLARGAYIGIAGALPVAAVVFWPALRAIDWRKAAPSIGLGALAVAAVLLSRGSDARARESSQVAEGSFVSRAAYYRAALHAIPEHLLFGHGTQRDNFAAPISVPKGTTITTHPDGTQEAHVSNGKNGTITVLRHPNGVQERIYYDPQGTQIAKLVSDPSRDPPLGSHSTILGIGYKYGAVGLAAFTALWLFIGLAPLRTIRTWAAASDARLLWIGVLAFGLQLPIYEYDFDSFSPYVFYLAAGLLLGLSVRRAGVELSPEESPAAAVAGTS